MLRWAVISSLVALLAAAGPAAAVARSMGLVLLGLFLLVLAAAAVVGSLARPGRGRNRGSAPRHDWLRR